MIHNKRFQINPVVSCGTEIDGAVLYNPDTDSTSVINLTGFELWTLLRTPHTENQIVDYLVQQYSGVSQEQAKEDTKIFIETLVPDFLLEIDNDR